MTLIWIPIFIIVHLQIIPSVQDLKRAFVIGNMYMILTLIINFSIGSNYFYTRHKPSGGSVLDYFGPWPVYIIVVEILAVFLFILAYIPFYKQKNRKTTS